MKINDVRLVKRFSPNSNSAVARKVSSQSTPDMSAKGLLVGQLVKALVAGFTEDGKVLLEINGKTLAAKAEVKLSSGQSVWLEVKEVEPNLILSQAARKVVAHKLLRSFFSDTSGLTDTLGQLFANPKLLADLSSGSLPHSVLPSFLASASSQDADVAKIMVLPDLLKILAAEFVGLRNGESDSFLENDPRFAGLKGRLDKFMHWLTSMHSLNSQPPGGEQLPIFIFPCLLAMGQGWGEWMISFPESEHSEAEDGGQYSLDFFLQLSRLGDTHLSLTVAKTSIFGIIEVGDGKIEGYIKKRLPQLINVLADLGFAKVDIVVRQTDKKSLQILQAVLTEKAQLSSCNMVDLTA